MTTELNHDERGTYCGECKCWDGKHDDDCSRSEKANKRTETRRKDGMKMLIARMARHIKKLEPNSDLPAFAFDYLKRAESEPSKVEPVAWFTEDHLTDKSATTYDREVADRWRAKGWPVTPLYAAPSAQTVAQEREAFEKEAVAWLYTCKKPGKLSVYASVDANDTNHWPEDQWTSVTKEPLRRAAPAQLIAYPDDPDDDAEFCKWREDHRIDLGDKWVAWAAWCAARDKYGARALLSAAQGKESGNG